jgi:hypothetical protein
VERSRPAWRIFRPVLFAAAAATSWIALSASAATADSAPEPDSLVKSISSSVGAITGSAADYAGSALRPITTQAAPTRDAKTLPADLASTLPKLKPVVHDVTTAADKLLTSVPAVKAVAPARPVTSLTDPVVGLTDKAAGTAAAIILPPVNAVVEILDPVVEILDPVVAPIISPDDRDPLPAPDIETNTPDAPAGGVASPAAPAPGASPGAKNSTVPLTVLHHGDAAADSAHASLLPSHGSGAALLTSACDQMQATAQGVTLSAKDPVEDPLDTLPEPTTGLPGSGSAGSASTGGAPQVPAWLTTHHFDIPVPAAVLVRGAVMNAPTPVSFDPGSSPD